MSIKNKQALGASFIKNISEEVLNSAAVHHPYLQAIREGDFADIDAALADFAFQYQFYSTAFTRYMSAVIETLSNAEHRQILQSNLEEEQGDTHDVALPPEVLATVVGKPHASLYRRFQHALGIGDEYRRTAHRCPVSLSWRQEFLQLCKMNECVGIGAIGIGTELIVSRIYNQILHGLKNHSSLTMTERVFFDLHSQCDDEHAAQLLLIAEALASDRTACEQIEYGARKAIELRVAFWDAMLERARRFPATSPANETVSSLGY